MRPTLLVIAGPNGAGKTTLTTTLRRDKWSEGVEYLNPDDVARERFGDWNSAAAVHQAAVWTTARREALLAAGLGLAFETVFSTQEKVDFLFRARDAGYFIRLFFVGTTSPTINAARVAERFMLGGHTVPIEKIVSRYFKAMTNLSAALAVSDRAYLYDNSVEGADARLVARTSQGLQRKIYGAVPTWIEDALGPLPRHPEFVDARTP